MSVTYYVALPFMRTEDGVAAGQGQECPNEGAAIRRRLGLHLSAFHYKIASGRDAASSC